MPKTYLHKAGPYKGRMMDTPEGAKVQHISHAPVDNAKHFMGPKGISEAKNNGFHLHKSGYLIHHDPKADDHYINVGWEHTKQDHKLHVSADPNTGIKNRAYFKKNSTTSLSSAMTI